MVNTILRKPLNVLIVEKLVEVTRCTDTILIDVKKGNKLVVCSCNEIDTAKIRAAIQFVHEPNERLVLNMMNWTPECANCGKVLVGEIRRLLKETMDGVQ